jgi:hypothetical protein
VGQKRVPFGRVVQEWPSGAGVGAASPGAGATAPARTAATRQRRTPLLDPNTPDRISVTRDVPRSAQAMRRLGNRCSCVGIVGDLMIGRGVAPSTAELVVGAGLVAAGAACLLQERWSP